MRLTESSPRILDGSIRRSLECAGWYVRYGDSRMSLDMMDQAFGRASGAPLIPDNEVRLLRDASENYPAWLEAIAAARRTIHFESYIIHEDEVGRRFAEAL